MGHMDGQDFRKLLLGQRVDSAAFAHANGDTDIFNVVGGRVLITLMYGVVTVAGGACTITAGNNPTLGTATSTDYSVAGDVNTCDVGDQIVFNYTAGQLTTTTGPGSALACCYLIALTGTIYITGSAVEGTSEWTVFYVPVDDGAYIEAI